VVGPQHCWQHWVCSPSSLFWLLSRILPFVRKSPFAATFLDGVNAASLGLMAGVTVQLGQTALIDTFTVVLFAITLFVIFRFRINSVWLILGAGLLGAIYKFVLG
jgi:chromate transporter